MAISFIFSHKRHSLNLNHLLFASFSFNSTSFPSPSCLTMSLGKEVDLKEKSIKNQMILIQRMSLIFEMIFHQETSIDH